MFFMYIWYFKENFITTKEWIWSFEVTLDDGTIIRSNVLRVESIDGCCCTCRILNPNGTGYNNTNNFVTIDLKCCGSIRCLTDTFVDLC